ncbi:MAG TPA: glycosyltransferase family 1 protein [Tissierellia bacterium]|nr:glycosyltransferase family 1 protein [Tissierellia bacterium]
MKTFIFLVGVKYDVIMKQRPHHMADYLASRGYKVLYIGID